MIIPLKEDNEVQLDWVVQMLFLVVENPWPLGYTKNEKNILQDTYKFSVILIDAATYDWLRDFMSQYSDLFFFHFSH